jgi:tagaturonate epimerase
MKIGKYSFGHGDRFGHQGKAQLSAIKKAVDLGAEITPVWNKSYREHMIVHTTPDDVRVEADAATKELVWTGQYCVDADHVGLKTVDSFIAASDFFTLDVADFIGEKASDENVVKFVESNKKYIGELSVPNIDEPFAVTEELVRSCAEQYLFAVQEAKRIFKHITATKPADSCVIEVSMDETKDPQTPVELFFILSAIAKVGIPAQTIAPKFTGRFNKGVDYVGDVEQFSKEFEQDIAVINFAIKEFGLLKNLKLSVHSGSDKFSIYKPIAAALKKSNAGLHLKTAGTTWLEELIGLAEAGGSGLEISKEIYANALGRFDELCKPYASVIDINQAALPSAEKVQSWDGKKYANTLRHDLSNANYNLNFRQLLHVGYKVAVELGDRYYQALKDNEEIIAKNVSENIFERHLKPLFLE